MAWEFSTDVPIYIQIINELKLRIISYQIPTGEKIDSVRELAQQAGVNPNTMQRALTELEREGLIYTERTSGRYVTTNKELVIKMREAFAAEHIQKVLATLLKLGYTKEELYQLIEKKLKGEK